MCSERSNQLGLDLSNENVVRLCVYNILRAKLTTKPELGSSIHRNFRESHEGHKPHAGLDPSRSTTGVVWTSEQAYKHGFADHPDEWANLGQGAPEVDDSIQGCFEVCLLCPAPDGSLTGLHRDRRR